MGSGRKFSSLGWMSFCVSRFFAGLHEEKEEECMGRFIVLYCIAAGLFGMCYGVRLILLGFFGIKLGRFC